MKNTVFTGAATAIITPMKNGGVDFEKFADLVEFQIKNGIDAIVVCGTTGESSTLTDEEHKELIRYCVEKVAGRVPVIAGTGSNCTREVIHAANVVKDFGVAAQLVVTPYYNKSTQEGLVAHYTEIAEKTSLPIVVYNVPSRTGCNLLPETCAALAGHPRIAAVKEASGNLSQIVSLFHKAEAHLDVYSGNDDQIVPILAMGGEGCISVLSNVLPKEAVRLCELFFSGDVRGAAALQCRLLPVIDALFSEVNPIPVKAALAKMGYGTDTLRLPLTPMEEGRRAVLLNALEAWGV
mgnify:CR=1 FL=1